MISRYLSTLYAALFRDFNTRFSQGRLLNYRVTVRHRIPGFNGDGFHVRGKRLIFLRACEDDAVMRSALVHEMAHAAANDYHGPKWQAEMARLAVAGAPLLKSELDPPIRLDRNLVFVCAMDALTEAPDATLKRFADWFATSYTWKRSGSDLLRSFPWIAAVFRDAQRTMP